MGKFQVILARLSLMIIWTTWIWPGEKEDSHEHQILSTIETVIGVKEKLIKLKKEDSHEH